MGEGAFTMDVIFFVCYFFFCVCVCVCGWMSFVWMYMIAVLCIIVSIQSSQPLVEELAG